MWKIFSSDKEDHLTVRSTVKRQVKQIKDIWKGKTYPNFGIERWLMLLLAILPFTDLGLYFRNMFQGEGRGLHRKLFVDFYVLVNLALPVATLSLRWYQYDWVVLICSYFSFETFIALLSMSFLTRNIPKAISYGRNIISLFLNFLQFVFLFAVLYMSWGKGCFEWNSNETMGRLQALYLSLETFTTVGFGDIVPVRRCGYVILIIQMLVAMVFIYLFFSAFVSKIGMETFYKKVGKTR